MFILPLRILYWKVRVELEHPRMKVMAIEIFRYIELNEKARKKNTQRIPAMYCVSLAHHSKYTIPAVFPGNYMMNNQCNTPASTVSIGNWSISGDTVSQVRLGITLPSAPYVPPLIGWNRVYAPYLHYFLQSTSPARATFFCDICYCHYQGSTGVSSGAGLMRCRV